MEPKVDLPGTRTKSYLVGVIPRIGAIVLAVFLLIVSAVAIGIIDKNKALQRVRDADYSVLSSDGEELKLLINATLAAAGWLMIMTGGVLIAEIIALVVVVLDLKWPVNLVFAIIETVFSIGAMICYLATGIACAVYSSEWVGPPDACPANDDAQVHCDSVPLTATSVLQCGFCFTQIGVFSFIIGVTIFNLLKNNGRQNT